MLSSQGCGADVLIIGAGAGGATFGYALARAGRSVLIVEQGPDTAGSECLRGMPPEAAPEFRCADDSQRRRMLVRSGRNPEAYEDGVSGGSFIPFVGYGTGGSSGLYGMVLERRYPHDFEGWPVQYRDLVSWYEQAERLFEVNGSPDPLRPTEPACPESPVPLSAPSQVVFDHLRWSGLHPYRLHLACRRTPECQLCQGYLCDSSHRCKNDARVTCLSPAIATGNARLLANARVVRLDSTGRQVTSAVVVQADGQEVRLTARLFVLAAGALSTPRILLRSGVANGSGLVGRRLMRHAIDLFVLSLAPRPRHRGESKDLGLNDYYADPNGWLGNVQSFGVTPPLEYLRNKPGRNLWRMLGPAAIPVSKVFQNAPIVASILADNPSVDNRVEEGPAGGRLVYRLLPADVKRRSVLRRRVLRAFSRFGPIPAFGTSDQQSLGHVCGTAVFGDSPATSVLNRQNRTHELENLYVVDGSFFPTSGGVNPALTIVANALRVADHVHREIL